MPYIHFDHVNKYFGQNHVLKDISLEIEQGELVTFLGPSGCGKSIWMVRISLTLSQNGAA